MAGKIVKFGADFEISESGVEVFTQALLSLTDEYGGSVFVQKDPKFEDLGLVELEKNTFQCLVCSRIMGPSRDAKSNMTKHFKNVHKKENQLERKVECPRCPEEVPKSSLNPHMDQKHGIKNFKQLLKRSFQPGADASKNSSNKKPKMTLDSDDKSPLNQDLNNNKTKTKQAGVKKGSKKNTKQEPDTSEYSADEMLKMMLDNDGVDPLTQTVSDNKTKTKPGVKKGSKKNIKQEPDTSDNSSNEMPKMTLDSGIEDPLDLNENKIKTEKDLEKSVKQEWEMNRKKLQVRRWIAKTQTICPRFEKNNVMKIQKIKVEKDKESLVQHLNQLMYVYISFK